MKLREKLARWLFCLEKDEIVFTLTDRQTANRIFTLFTNDNLGKLLKLLEPFDVPHYMQKELFDNYSKVVKTLVPAHLRTPLLHKKELETFMALLKDTDDENKAHFQKTAESMSHAQREIAGITKNDNGQWGQKDETP